MRARPEGWILALAFVAHTLFFVRVAVVFAPNLYLGPSGADRVFYFAYARSLVLDGDLDFRNEIARRPPSSGVRMKDGRVLNRYPIGAPLLSLPAYAATHVAVRTLRAAGWSHLDAGGYGRPYVLAYALAQLAWASLGFWLLYRVGRRFFPPVRAALGVAAAMVSTPLLLYTAADLMMSHAASSFATAWCLLASLRAREEPERSWRWCALGAAAVLLVLVRYQNVVYLAAPAVVVARCLPRGRAGARALLATVAGASAFLAPQLLAWRAAYGRWFVHAYAGDVRFDWSPARLVAALLDPAILGRWAPLLALGIGACLALGWARRDGLVAASAGGSLAAVVVAAAWFWPDVAARSVCDNLATFSLGFAALARPGAAPLALFASLAAWNVPFVLAGPLGAPAAGWAEVLSAWWRGARWLL